MTHLEHSKHLLHKLPLGVMGAFLWIGAAHAFADLFLGRVVCRYSQGNFVLVISFAIFHACGVFNQ
jgi:hypothetical protein